MSVLRTGAPCPCCGQPIPLTAPDALRLRWPIVARAAPMADGSWGIIFTLCAATTTRMMVNG